MSKTPKQVVMECRAALNRPDAAAAAALYHAERPVGQSNNQGFERRKPNSSPDQFVTSVKPPVSKAGISPGSHSVDKKCPLPCHSNV
jgi:hypothetical protein